MFSISTDVKTSFRDAGVAHVLVVSGLHIGFVALFLFFFIQWLLRWSLTILLSGTLFPITAALTIFGIWPYIFIAGAHLSAVRAGIMITIYLIAVIFRRRHDLANIVALAALIILIHQPLALFQVSFQLSFSAVLFDNTIHGYNAL